MGGVMRTRQQWFDLYKSLNWKIIPVKIWWNEEKKKWEKSPLEKWDNPQFEKYVDNPEIGFGVVFETCFAVDFDRCEKATDLLTLTFISKVNNVTKEFTTKSGNWQAIFKMPSNLVITNQQDIFNTKDKAYQIDIRGKGGYSVIPPSDGYEWKNKFKIQDCPKEVLDLIKAPTGIVAVPVYKRTDLPVTNRHKWFQENFMSSLARGDTYERAITHYLAINKGLSQPLDEGDLRDFLDRHYKLHSRNNPVFTIPTVNSYYNGFEGILEDIEGKPEPSPEFTTGFEKLDMTTWGFSRGHLTVLSGVSEAGKSMLVQISFLRNLERGKRCLMLSAELTKKDVHKRMLIHELGIQSNKFNTHEFTSDEKDFIRGQVEFWKREYGQNMMIYTDNLSPESIDKMTRKIQPDMVIIDYFQNLIFEGDGHMYMTRVVQILHSLAKDLNIPVIVLSQLHDSYAYVKDRETGQVRKVKIDSTRGDVKMTKALIQSADVLITLNYHHDEQSGLKAVKIGVEKNKVTGRTKSLYYILDTDTLRYKETTYDGYQSVGT